jgi:hypothetical protein
MPRASRTSQPRMKRALRKKAVRTLAARRIRHLKPQVPKAPHRVTTSKFPAHHTSDKETDSSPRSRSPLERLPMSSATALRNNFIDPQPSSLKFKEEGLDQTMDPSDQNYALAPSSSQSVFPGSLVPRSAIPRTVEPKLSASTLLALFPDALQGLSVSELSSRVAESNRYRDMAYAQEPVPTPPDAQRTEREASERPSQTRTSFIAQNAQAAEARQHQPRIQVPDQNGNEEAEEDQENSSSEDLSNPHGCRQH